MEKIHDWRCNAALKWIIIHTSPCARFRFKIEQFRIQFQSHGLVQHASISLASINSLLVMHRFVCQNSCHVIFSRFSCRKRPCHLPSLHNPQSWQVSCFVSGSVSLHLQLQWDIATPRPTSRSLPSLQLVCVGTAGSTGQRHTAEDKTAYI